MRTKNEQNKWNVFGMHSTTNKYTTSLGKLVLIYLAFVLSSIGYDSNTVFFLESTVLQSPSGGSIHCGTILKRER